MHNDLYLSPEGQIRVGFPPKSHALYAGKKRLLNEEIYTWTRLSLR